MATTGIDPASLALVFGGMLFRQSEETMKTTFLFVIACLVVNQAAVAQQPKALKTCPVLTAAEAAAVLGSKTPLVTGTETVDGQVRTNLFCDFLAGERRLQISISPTLGDKSAWEALRNAVGGAVESGLGDYAYFTIKETEAGLLIVKGALTITVSLRGGGVTKAELPKLREAAKKVLPRT